MGLSVFKATKRVITEVDKLMHICACIDLSCKFLGDDRQKNAVFAAAVAISEEPSAVNVHKHHAVDHCREKTNDDDEPLQQERLIAQPVVKSILEVEAADHRKEEENKIKLQSFLNYSRESELKPELDDAMPELEVEFPEEDLDMRLARILTMEELTMEIQAILYCVNQNFEGQSQALADEFIDLQEAIQATLQEINNAPQRPPPAAKEEIEKLSIVAVTKHVLAKLDDGTQCAVCREPLVEGDIMQEMPCLHPYHLECLRPWLEKHNSCPICRFELRTEDEDYEQQK